MASLLKAPLFLPSLNLHKVNHVSSPAIFPNVQYKFDQASVGNGRYHVSSLAVKAQQGTVEGNVLEKEPVRVNEETDYGVVSVHHVGILCENLERSLDFYQNMLGLKINEARPHDKLPYRGAWLWVGSEMIHLMELPNPDPLTGRPEHGGRDRHTCIAIRDVSKLKAIFDEAGIPYTLSKSGRPAIFTRDPDANALEFTQVDV
ncbi:putative lactoylglutathione lyase [Senna tora]|uniref:Putative lactoylglutathione lyase n=1 Tax=Senna tora TaxID=362788 RepID=A0A834SPV7_9FABA|nr:putative lactoylglutathione lyase [Senna tora]